MHAKLSLKKGIFWMSELELEELERNLVENDSCKEQERRADDIGNNLGEVRDILTPLETDERIDNLEDKKLPLLNK